MSKAKTILFLETGTQGGGSFVILMTLLKQIDRELFRPVVCCLNEPRNLDEFEALGVPVFVLSDPVFSCKPAIRHQLMRVVQRVVNQFIPMIRPFYEPLIHGGTIRRLKKIIVEESADLIVLCTQINRDLFGTFLAEKCEVPVVSHLRSRNGQGFTRKLAERVNAQVSRMTADSGACRDYWIERGVNADKIEVVYNAVTPKDVHPVDLHTEFGLPSGAPVIGCVGRLIDIKGQDILLKALSRLEEKHSDAVVLLVGDGTRRERLEKLARELGVESRVVFTGWRTDACSLTAAADVLVQPSREEALGLTLLEGMSLGTTVIGSRAGGIPEVIDHETGGLLVEVDDPDGLASALDRLLSDSALREQLAAGGRKTVEEKFSPALCVRSTERVYRSAIEEHL